MRFTTDETCRRLKINLDAVGSIHRSGSVLGMQHKYGWPKGGQVRVGSYIYNVGRNAVDALRSSGQLYGER